MEPNAEENLKWGRLLKMVYLCCDSDGFGILLFINLGLLLNSRLGIGCLDKLVVFF
jgi:hypothetical protein